ncbi:MAG: hypothetical protein N2559_06465 [Anaerolineae bacterium]|nr:hypothetical protein [Anaerolineae bacterium]
MTVTLLVIDALEKLNVRYLIGGSLASALYGMPRATLDADLVADLRLEHAEPLARALTNAFYVDAEMIREAIRQQRSFNVIHFATAFKVDVFVRKNRAFDESQLTRRVRQIVATDPERAVFVASAEDTILAKLEWYRLGGETSERQWRDVLGIVKTQGERLDQNYLREWAVQLGVEDLLEKILKEAKE